VPSEWHDAVVGLVKDRPGLPVEILRDIMGVDIPDQPVWREPGSPFFGIRVNVKFIQNATRMHIPHTGICCHSLA
jgi:hypothetical protein